MLSAALRRNVCNCSLKDLEKCLLNALARYVTGDRAVFASGAIKAAEFIADKKQGLFNMSNVIND